MSSAFEANALECVRGGRVLFRDMNFSLEPGELLEVTGTNGSGKTSLLRLLCGLMPPTAGEIRWHGDNIRALKEEYLKVLAYLGHANGIKAELSAPENLRIYGGLAGVSPGKEKIGAALHRIGLGGHEASPVKTLSQGQQRRLALARLLVGDKSLWILDEPLTALDADAVRLVQTVIGEHLGKGGMAILATHQRLDVCAGSTRRIDLTGAGGH